MTTHSGLRMYTLGDFLIERDGQRIESFLTRKTALLLVYLAMNPGNHARETLAPLFWSETSDEQALKNLRTVLSDLRKNTPDALQITRQAVGINEAVWIDARQFTAGCDAIFAGANTRLDDMLSLVDLYNGEFLRDLYIRNADVLQAWIIQCSEDLQRKYERLLFHIVSHCLKTDNAHTGVKIARQLVALNPLWEAAQRQLMQLLVKLDQSGEALLQYERVVVLLDAELGVDPDSETVTLYQQIKSGAIPAARPQPVSHIVLPDIPYIPPQNDLALLRGMLNKPDCRLITLSGMGGTGKTMLATFTAHERQDAYPDGVVIVSLAAVHDMKMLPQTILSSLGVIVNGTASADQVVTELSECAMLLILDNYEHLLPDTSLISRLINEAPNVQLLVTSQVALNLSTEWLLPINGLGITQSGESEAMQLFRKTAERTSPHFDMASCHDEIREICALLDGLPLGIVIAASQVKYYSPSEILGKLRHDLLALTSPYQDLPARHRGLTNLIHATLKHLSDEEQHALQALSIFRGSFQHEAALAVADMDMQTFIRLVDKSLIQRTENFRYSIHSLLKHEFVRQLAQSAHPDTVRQRLTAYYIAWCHSQYRRKNAQVDLLCIDREHVNIWHLDLLDEFEQAHYLLEIIPALRTYWRNRGYAEQVSAILQLAFDDERYPSDLRARGMVELASILLMTGKQEQVEVLCECAIVTAPENLYVQVVALQQLAWLDMQRGNHHEARSRLMIVSALESNGGQSDDPQLEYQFIHNHNSLGLAAMYLDETDIARIHFNIAINGYRRLDEMFRAVQVGNNIAVLDVLEGNIEAARQHYETALPLVKASGIDSSIIAVTANLGWTLMLLGDYVAAHVRLSEAITMALRLKRKTSFLYQLETFAELAYRIEQFPIAAQLYGYVLKLCEESHIALPLDTMTKIENYISTIQSNLGSRYDQLAELGAKLSQDAALGLAQSLAMYLTPSAE